MAFLEEYTLLDELGQGGYATVYKVRHNNLGYIRAIRVLNAIIAHGETDKTYQKFLEECRLLLRLGNGSHPNIVHIYQPLLKAQRAIVEMDFVDGKDLYHYLEEKHSFVEIKDVINLLSDIGSALAYCHEDIYKFCMDKEEDNLQDDPNDGRKVLLDDNTKQRLISKYRVIHNDIHSGNIIRREDGTFVLLDFGLAIEGNSVIRSSRRKNGAPEFKAPEKWDNDSILSTQSDIYSFGVVLYEYLAGRVPFLFDKKNSNTVEAEYLLGKAHKEQQPASIFNLRKVAFENSHPGETYEKDYPDWLEKLIMKCLSKSINDRFKNGKELYSFFLEHSGNESEAKIAGLKQEITALQNKINSLEATTTISSKDADNLITDLQEQLKEALLIKSDLEYKLNKLQSERDKSNNFQGINEQINEACETLRQKITNLEFRLNQTEVELQDASNELSKLLDENTILQEENSKLQNEKRPKSGKSWKILSLILLLLIAFIGYLYVFDSNENDFAYKPVDVSPVIDDNEMVILIQERDSLLNTSDYYFNECQNKDEQISALNSIINDLNKEVSRLKSSKQQNGYSQHDIDLLNNEIKRLQNQIEEKNRLIRALNKQLGI